MIRWLLRKLWPEPKPRGPAHIYPLPGTVLAAYYPPGKCMFCPRVDPEETAFTDPPCPRRVDEVA